LAGDNPPEAVANFIEPLQRALSCITRAVINVRGGFYPADEPHVLTVGTGESVQLGGESRLALTTTMHYRIVEGSGERGPWKVEIVAYAYALDGPDGREIIAYHWHPRERTAQASPHIHLGAGIGIGDHPIGQAHLPSGRVALEEVLRLAIADLGAASLRDDWETVLHSTQSSFERWRTWPSGTPQVSPPAE
jgi:hypothetical protein